MTLQRRPDVYKRKHEEKKKTRKILQSRTLPLFSLYPLVAARPACNRVIIKETRQACTHCITFSDYFIERFSVIRLSLAAPRASDLSDRSGANVEAGGF